MSKPRYNWWAFALAMIRDYPLRRIELRNMKEQKRTAGTDASPGGGDGRTVERLAMKTLPEAEQKEHDAVYYALKRTKLMTDADIRGNVVRLTLWRGFSVRAAAYALHISERTARRYRWQFVMLVGHMYGLLDEGSYRAAVEKDAPK